eukprot:Hpha_TRINITY_DN927_c0_g1::TRINITY_DN927_c0_g1_i1::g.156342::m.156342
MAISRESELFLKVLGTIWTSYGAWCFFYPVYTVERFFGLKLARDAHWGVAPELAAMYGGLQMGVGLNGLYAALYDKANRGGGIATLRSFMLAMGMLGILRLLAVLRQRKSIVPALTLRVLTEGLDALLPEFYNANAIWFFELPGAVIAYILMKREMKKLQDKEK